MPANNYITNVVVGTGAVGISKLNFTDKLGNTACYPTACNPATASDTELSNIFLIAIDTQYQNDVLVNIKLYYVTEAIGVAAASS